MDKYDYVESIVLVLQGTTGINYQLKLREVLRRFHKYKNKTYEMPDYYGGDQKNDGWVVEDAIFYQVFAPTRLKESLKKEIQNKFEEDLERLIELVYNEGKWSGVINEFVFIVNTIDNNIPHDSERFFENKVNKLKNKYSIEFEYRVTNTDYIRDLLYEINDIKVLEEISSILKIKGLIDYNAISETMIINIIDEISGNIHVKFMSNDTEDTYNRISSPKKIIINHLEDRNDEIDNIIDKLDTVEQAINSINQDIMSANKFERVKNAIINNYNELSDEFSGCELYDELIRELLKFTSKKTAYILPVKFLIIYIFDKCDIFEKE